MIRGIDVSHYQGSVDWAAIKAKYHLSFGAAKIGEGTAFVDSHGRQNRDRIRAAGLRFIGYWYATPSASSPRTQAAKLVALTDPRPGEALCLDLEKSSLSQTATNTWMRGFGDALRDLAPGIATIAYLGGYASNGSGRAAVAHFDHWWYPRYASMKPATVWPATFDPTVAAPNLTGFTGLRAPSIWQWSPNVGGMDANVSALTVSQLFDGGTVALTQSDLDAIAHAIASYKRDPAGPQAWQWWQQASNASTQARDSLPGYVDQIADAVIAKLPTNPGGGATPDEVKQAVKDALKEGIGS